MTTGFETKRSTDGLIKVAFPAMLLTLSPAGTGGSDYFRVLNAEVLAHTQQAVGADHVSINVAVAADDLSRIKSVLKISTTDLAATLGVSRQALYNWKSGSHIKAHNLSKLENLKRATDAFIEARITVSSLMLERKLPGGMSFLEKISSGEDGAAAAHSLVSLLAYEADQRHALDELLAGNVSRKPDAFDYGAPAVRED